MELPTWVHFTVPHSGTRYTNNTFERSGYTVQSFWDLSKNEPGTDMVWQHWNPKVLRHQVPLIQAIENRIVTVRDPIMTFASHWKNLNEEPNEAQRAEAASFRMERLQNCWGMQHALVEWYDFHVHRVDKDSIEDLGKAVGANLTTPGDKSESPMYPMKQAVLDRDVGKIMKLSDGTRYWNKFRGAVAQYGEFYESHGYDLWWL